MYLNSLFYVSAGSIHGTRSTTLKILNLSSNGLTGTLPTFLQRCSVVDLSGNMITGGLSVMQQWGASVEVLDLSSNQLSRSLANLTRFVRFYAMYLDEKFEFVVFERKVREDERKFDEGDESGCRENRDDFDYHNWTYLIVLCFSSVARDQHFRTLVIRIYQAGSFS